MNENVQIELFEGQEVKVKTDQGVELFNLANTAKCCGLVIRDKRRETERVSWKGNRSVCDKLSKILSSP